MSVSALPPAPLRAMLWWSRAWGLAPYRLDSESGLFRASAPLRALSVVLSLMVAAATFLYMHYFKWDTDSAVGSFTMEVFRVVEMAQCLVLCPVLWWQLHPHLLPLLNADPVRLGAAAVPLRYPGLTLTITASCLSASLLTWCICFLPYGPVYSALHAGLCLLCFMNQVAVTTYFSYLVHSLARQLAALNQTLLKYLMTLKRRGRRCSTFDQLLRGSIVSLRREHARAISALGVLSGVFGVPLALQGIADFWHLVSYLYLTANREISGGMNLLQGLWDLGICTRWAYVIAASFMVSTQGNRTKTILNEFITECSELATSEELHEVQRFCLVLSQQPARVAVLGVELNASFLWQIAAALVTYVVILMQFQSSCSAAKRN